MSIHDLSFATGDGPHKPVLLREVLDALSPGAGEIMVDGTFGAGGYSRAILDHADCELYAIDRDPTAVATGGSLGTSTIGSRSTATTARRVVACRKIFRCVATP